MTSSEEDTRKLNEMMSVGTTVDIELPPMMTEAAKAIKPPNWWKGTTTETDAMTIADGMRKGRKR